MIGTWSSLSIILAATTTILNSPLSRVLSNNILLEVTD